MVLIIFGSILFMLATFLPSFLEAGAFLWVAFTEKRDGDLNSELHEKTSNGLQIAMVVVPAMVLVRTQVEIALGYWVAGNLYNGKETNQILIISTVFTTAFLLGEVIGKLVAMRFPAHARRAVKPIRRFLARIKPVWFRFG